MAHQQLPVYEKKSAIRPLKCYYNDNVCNNFLFDTFAALYGDTQCFRCCEHVVIKLKNTSENVI